MAVNFKLYLITDRKQVKMPLPAAVRLALEGGVRAIQLREKDLPIRELLALSQELRTITKEFGARLFINDRVDVAVAVNADGVHLGHESMPVEAVRKIVGKDMLIGVSTHNLAEAKAAEAGGADFITIGPIFDTPSKAKLGVPVGLSILKELKYELNIPFYALGGVKSGNMAQVFNAGATGVSMISAIMAEEDIKKASSKLIAAIAYIDKIICEYCAPR
ncbi:MAG: thiamine phosphate synthase [Nitrospirae bacterium]|nr:thiamine phosphate synthase [Nitrospirota bacterium]